MANHIFKVPVPRNTAKERRGKDRVSIKSPIKVHFSLPFEGEIMDMSSEGISFKFHPLGSTRLNVGETLQFQMDMGSRIVSMEGCIRRLDEKFGHFVIGMKYDRHAITLFDFNEKPAGPDAIGHEDIPPDDNAGDM